MLFKAEKRFAPEGFVLAEPIADQRQGFCIETAQAGGALAARVDEACGVELTQVLGNSRPAHAEVLRESAYGMFAPAQNAKDGAPRGVGDGAKDSGCLSGRFRNHMVTNMKPIGFLVKMKLV